MDAINATGYGLTLGIHSRIDSTVRRVARASRGQRLRQPQHDRRRGRHAAVRRLRPVGHRDPRPAGRTTCTASRMSDASRSTPRRSAATRRCWRWSGRRTWDSASSTSSRSASGRRVRTPWADERRAGVRRRTSIERGLLDRTARVGVQVYGSLALTGKGHCTDRAVRSGSEGQRPETIEPDGMEPALARVRASRRLRLGGRREIEFDEPSTCSFTATSVLPLHPNGMRFTALRRRRRDAASARSMYSTGGGFCHAPRNSARSAPTPRRVAMPHPFPSARELLQGCRDRGLELHELVLANERALPARCRDGGGAARDLVGDARLHRARLRRQRACCRACCRCEAPRARGCTACWWESAGTRPLDAMDWVNAFALAVNEENAAGGRVVTAPTNGAAGIVPGGDALLPAIPPGRAGRRGAIPARRPARSACSTSATRRSPARNGLPGRGRRGLFDGGRGTRRGAERHATSRWRTPRRSAWSTWGSPAIRSPGWCRFPASSATRWAP